MNYNEPIYISIHILAKHLKIRNSTLLTFLGHFSLSKYKTKIKNTYHFMVTQASLNVLKKYLTKKGNYRNDYSKAIRNLTILIDNFEKTGEINENIGERERNFADVMLT